MKLKKLILTAILSAVAIVLYEYLDLKIPPQSTFFTLSLGIIPIFFMAYYCGIVYATIGAIVVDVLGMVVAGSSLNTFYFGFTLNALLSGLILSLIMKYKGWFDGNRGRIAITIFEILVSVITIPIYIYFFNKTGAFNKYENHNVVYVVSVFSVLLNFAVIVYAWLLNREEGSNAVLASYCVYQLIVSLCLTPLWVHNLYGANYIALWTTRLITVPVLTMVYASITRLILVPLNKKFKAN